MPGSNAPPGPGASRSNSSRMARWISVVSVVVVAAAAAASVDRCGCDDDDDDCCRDDCNFDFGGSLGVLLAVAALAATAAAVSAGTHPQDVSLLQRCLFMAELHESRLPVPQPVGLLTIEILLHVEHHHSSTAPGPGRFFFCFVWFWFILLFF